MDKRKVGVWFKYLDHQNIDTVVYEYNPEVEEFIIDWNKKQVIKRDRKYEIK